MKNTNIGFGIDACEVKLDNIISTAKIWYDSQNFSGKESSSELCRDFLKFHSIDFFEKVQIDFLTGFFIIFLNETFLKLGKVNNANIYI